MFSEPIDHDVFISSAKLKTYMQQDHHTSYLRLFILKLQINYELKLYSG